MLNQPYSLWLAQQTFCALSSGVVDRQGQYLLVLFQIAGQIF